MGVAKDRPSDLQGGVEDAGRRQGMGAEGGGKPLHGIHHAEVRCLLVSTALNDAVDDDDRDDDRQQHLQGGGGHHQQPADGEGGAIGLQPAQQPPQQAQVEHGAGKVRFEQSVVALGGGRGHLERRRYWNWVFPIALPPLHFGVQMAVLG